MAIDLKPLGALLLAAAGVVGTVFGLFGSVLHELVPPSRELASTLYAGIASLAALLILLGIVLLMPARLTLRQRRWIVAFTAVLSVAAFYALLSYVGTLNTFVFRYPDSSTAGQKPQRYIRGQYTELGATITKDMSVAAALNSVGGLDMARNNQLLWTEQSQKETEMRLVRHYVVSLALLTAALFSVLIAVYQIGRSK
ncbi:hypothetical protein LJR290_004003 [Variovorax sp. LjRoot290]|uniref:hypothetical protein n=1 Tax=unclassified Variovorax TaxID=663243 RepID=UPI003ED063DA